ncbi:amino acid permease [Streptomyces sp. SID3343]|uniref:amino acid permease n=1 Tax=Streptomyces sp. SID3343 TaxID=2690260 RepID=UPI001369EC6C|nr:amino acid permease [Streptomyces sp. SID3343]MYV98021.1 amino acid permease [Streptomyces sp. SID3343]
MTSSATPDSPPDPVAPDDAPHPGDAIRLGHTLKPRHMTMLALGGAIGAGLFVGTGAGIHTAGPGILVSYALASVLVLLVMRMLGEMAAAVPRSGSFSEYAQVAFGPWAGFTVGWLYWWMVTVVLAVEASGAAAIAHGWAPGVPIWVFSLAIMLVFTGANLLTVRAFGESEFWFATVKIAAIVAFLVLGVLAIAGWLPDTEAPGLTNLTGHGGFLPNGWDGVVAGLLAVAFSFGGLEIVTIAAAESNDPARNVARAVRTAVWRILLFYIGSVAIVATLLPWDSDRLGSPYVSVLEVVGIPGAADVMNVVVFTALLSALNSMLYGGSRMAFSLSRRGEGPRPLSRVARNGVPRTAVLASSAFGFVAALLNVWWPEQVFKHLLNSVGAMLVFVWFAITASQLVLRRRFEREDPERLIVRMWGFPYLTWFVLVALGVVCVLMLFDADARPQLLSSVVVVAIVSAFALVRETRRRAPRKRAAGRF